MWPRLLPPAMLGGWIWGDTRGGFQRKVFLGSGRDVLGLSLTLPAETCQRGARLKKSHPPSIKKKEKNKKKHKKNLTTTTKLQLLLLTLSHSPRAGNTTKLRGGWQLLSAFMPRSTHSQEPTSNPAHVSALPAGAGVRRDPWEHPPHRRGPFSSPKTEIDPVVGLAGLCSPRLRPDMSEPRLVSGPVKSHTLGRCSEPPPRPAGVEPA